jgi:hypothetical protein
MGRLTSLFKKLRPRERKRSDEESLNDEKLDARTHDMLHGKGLGPTGAVMDFERDSTRRR